MVSPLLLALVLVCTCSSSKNMRSFWAAQLGVKTLDFDSEAGMITPMQVHTTSNVGFQKIDWYYSDAKMFYQLYSSIGGSFSAPSTPLILWLQGGPGYTSMFGSFSEIGPINIVNGKPQRRQFAWNDNANLLFVDQPLNVGWSTNGDKQGPNQVSSSDQAAAHLLNFLSNFYYSWPLLKKCTLYIAGQSYAGHYIPALARAMLISNKTFLSTLGVTLGGIIIGNGWVDPINQINFYDSYLYSVGIVSNRFRDVCTWFQTNSILSIQKNNLTAATAYNDFITHNATTANTYFGGVNTFNFRRYSLYDESFQAFVQSNKAAFGIINEEFVISNEAVRNAFTQDIVRSYSGALSQVLALTRVLILNGQQDITVNHAGVMQYLTSLQWTSIQNWKQSRKSIWKVFGDVKGWTKVSGNLWFAVVYKAGHAAPVDQPASCLNLITHFLTNNRNWDE